MNLTSEMKPCEACHITASFLLDLGSHISSACEAFVVSLSGFFFFYPESDFNIKNLYKATCRIKYLKLNIQILHNLAK